MTRALTAAAAVGFACLAAATAEAALDTERTLTVSGTERSYCLYRPDSYRDGAPVVFYFHGYGADCRGPDVMRWRNKADREGFLLVAPEGLDGDWNACSAPPQACRTPRSYNEFVNVDDLAYFDALSETVGAEFLTGPLYVTGMSKGGMFVYNLLCRRADAIDAGAAVSADDLSQACADASAPLLHLHGHDDRFVPWAGGGILGMTYPPVIGGIEAQAARNGCADGVVSRTETRDATSYAYQGCDSETVYWRYSCQHGWPGLSSGWFWWMFGLGCTRSFHAEDVIWSFFERN